MCSLKLPVLGWCLALAACGAYNRLTAPAELRDIPMPASGQVPDAMLTEVIEDGDLVVLGTPVEAVSEAGVFRPTFQGGSKETWYSAKIAVDAVAKGKLKDAKRVDLGFAPATLTPGPRFGKLARNEIVVQYPVVESASNHWGQAPPLFVGERAVYIFKKCYYCVELTGLPNARGPYYKANPWVAMTRASKLPAEEWPRVVQLVAKAEFAKKH